MKCHLINYTFITLILRYIELYKFASMLFGVIIVGQFFYNYQTAIFILYIIQKMVSILYTQIKLN